MKKCWRVLAVLLAALLIAGCAGDKTTQSEKIEMPKLSEELKQKIETAWLEAKHYELDDWYNDNPEGTRHMLVSYLGAYEGYEVVFVETLLCAVEEKEIAGELFRNSKCFNIYLYQGKEFHRLEDAYADGMIGAESVHEIAQIYRQCQQEIAERKRKEN